MKRLILGAGLFLAVFVTIRRLAPKLGRQAMKECEEMMSHMGSESAPKQMMERMQAMSTQQSREDRCKGCEPEKATEPEAAVP